MLFVSVVFRSKRNEESRSSDRGLYEADAKAHEEAIRAGGVSNPSLPISPQIPDPPYLHRPITL